MHGSGTSAVGQILASLGVHLGSRLDSHFEANEFWDLNEEIYYRAGASWHRPEPLLHGLRNPAFRLSATARLSQATFGSLRGFFAGTRLREGALWGWKDPRTSLTLPLWLSLFPEARVVHVLREPEAAAQSIHRRAHREAEAGCPASGGAMGPRSRNLARALLSPGAALRAAGRRLGVVPPVPAEDPCLDLDHCRTVAEQYVESCRRWHTQGADWIEVRYEELLRNPEGEVASLARFIGPAPRPDDLERAAAVVRRTR